MTRTLVIADTHIGTGHSLAIAPACLERLIPELIWADRVVLNGDIFSFGSASIADCLAQARPLLALLDQHAREVVYLIGNHDFHFAQQAIDKRRWAELTGQPGDRRPLPLAADLLARYLPNITITTAHPYITLDQVTITHGYQVNAHFGPLKGQALKHGYDAIVGPYYEGFYTLRQGHPSLKRPAIWGELLQTVGRLAPPNGGLRPVGQVLPIMSEVCARLGVPPGIVVFGHLHQVVEPTWIGSYCLVNSGGWFYDKFILDHDDEPRSSWPGGVVRLEGQQVEIRRLLSDFSQHQLAQLAA